MRLICKPKSDAESGHATGFVRVRLGDVCISRTSSIRQKDLCGCNGCYPIYGASGEIAHVNFFAHDCPCIGVVKDGAGVGRIMRLPAKSSVIGTLMALIPSEKILRDYLYYLLSEMHLERFCTGATIPHVYFKDFKDIEVMLPLLTGQRIIVAKLDQICNLIAMRKEQLAKFDQLVKSRFVEAA